MQCPMKKYSNPSKNIMSVKFKKKMQVFLQINNANHKSIFTIKMSIIIIIVRVKIKITITLTLVTLTLFQNTENLIVLIFLSN